ncbi:MAG: radical SAM protein [Lachnospiraceae bacterium]|nr:radical SAM protein [Lachnospiraceae bacterium]
MKASRFNYRFNQEGATYLYNSLTGLESIMKIYDKDLQEEAKNFLEGKESKHSNPVIENLLKEKGYLIDGDTDEFKLVESKKEKLLTDEKLTLTLIPTSGCNFKCVYCYEEFKPIMMSERTIDDVVRFTEKFLGGKKVLFVNWFGGEPLLALNVIEALTAKLRTLCKEKKVAYFAGVTTNGYLLTMENFKRLAACRVIDYQVSIDGLKEDHDRLRCLKNKGGTYDVIFENLKRISDEVTGNRFSISIRCNCLKASKEKREEAENIFYENFGKDERFSITFHAVKDWGGESVNALRKELLTEQEEIDLLNEALRDKSEKRMKKLTHLNVLDSRSNSCFACKADNYVIGADGSIYKCTSDFDKPLGNVSKGDSPTEWFDITKETNLREECRECAFYGACMNTICPKALKEGKLMCPIEKDCIDSLIGSMGKEYFTERIPGLYEYRKE